MMVIGLLTITAIPTTIGTAEAVSAQKKQNAAMKEKAKFHLTTTVSLTGEAPTECFVVLAGGRLFLDHPAARVPAHRFTGYYFTYPSEAQLRGLVSTIADDPPMLNWIFEDKDSHMLRHGGRSDTQGGHVIGPWSWTDDEEFLTLDGDESRFVAVEHVLDARGNRAWALYCDRDRSIRGEDAGDRQSGLVGGGSESDDESEDEQEGGGERQRWVAVRLHRKMVLGMESRYVKGANG